jgi:hypothetical protein
MDLVVIIILEDLQVEAGVQLHHQAVVTQEEMEGPLLLQVAEIQAAVAPQVETVPLHQVVEAQEAELIQVEALTEMVVTAVVPVEVIQTRPEQVLTLPLEHILQLSNPVTLPAQLVEVFWQPVLVLWPFSLFLHEFRLITRFTRNKYTS